VATDGNARSLKITELALAACTADLSFGTAVEPTNRS
jgi:hypothetical protein